MNLSLKANFHSKSLAYYISLLAAILALVSLFIFIPYSASNGSTSISVYLCIILGILIQLGMFFLLEPYIDLVSIIVPILYMVALGEELHTGVGNIVDSFQGIHMFGNSALASTNYLLAVLLMCAVVISLVCCFLPKTKKDQSVKKAQA